MKIDRNALATAAALAAGGALWPEAFCTATYWMASPVERAMQTGAFCGAGPQAFEVLGHCAVCWSGAAAFLAAAAAVLARALTPRQALA